MVFTVDDIILKVENLMLLVVLRRHRRHRCAGASESACLHTRS